ncbi:hypothetical protein HSBAA_00170 [Vreelandella sulfidaeris]|uniref:Uncharacterized protein n=1 Tax=Vreelandella sulfidaeris TaxID=115553 RepID=A0A455U2J8_9GAMM|nr:hypothetical protein HSBAA_00170 [Halomonas sulfidaeris]
MAVNTLLLELGAEELPPSALDALSDAFAAGIEKACKTLTFPSPMWPPLLPRAV